MISIALNDQLHLTRFLKKESAFGLNKKGPKLNAKILFKGNFYVFHKKNNLFKLCYIELYSNFLIKFDDTSR